MTTAIVLGAAVRADGTASPTLRLRVEHAVGLFEEEIVDRICVTGGQGEHGPPEAQVARALALVQGIPADALIVEDMSKSTFENLAFARPLVSGPIVIVSNRWHLPRALLIARIMGWPATGSGPRGTAPLQKTAGAILREVATAPMSVLRAIRWVRRSAR